MAIGIFGGTFNPPHLGHLRLARAFAARFSLQRVLVIPTFVPPPKQTPDLANAEARVQMCRLLFDEAPFEVSTMEIERGGCTVCAAVREKGKTLDANGCVLLEDFDPIEISSTQVRERVRLGLDVTDAVGEPVARFIVEKGLYADAYTPARKRLREKLGDYRLRHSFCVADAAQMLAERYGADPEKAYFAGLLHDVMKDAPREDQRRMIENGGAVLTDAESANEKLWHAVAGEAYLRTQMGVRDPDVLNAVRYHTTGRAKMSLLEKILYVADYMSADREYNGVERMRRLAESSLEEAMLFGLSFTISDLAQKEQIIHPDSVDCYNEICMEMQKKGT